MTRLIRYRWLLLSIGSMLLGAGLTYLLIPPTIVSGNGIEVNPSDLIAAQQRETQPMPSVLGLDRDVAHTVLDDAGLAGVRADVVERPAAGPVAMVLAQRPSPGTDPVTSIELTVSTPAAMPDLLGKTVSEGRAQLEQLGAVVEIAPRFDPTVPKGQILDATPRPGETMPTVVTLTVGDPGDALTLASVSHVERDDCRTVDSASVNGQPVGDSLRCTPGRDPAYIEYSLARNAATLEALIGTDDRGGTGAATITILGDGRVLSSTPVSLGHSEPVRVDLNGVMRLRIEVATPETKQRPTAILGDARLLGLPQGLDAIAASR